VVVVLVVTRVPAALEVLVVQLLQVLVVQPLPTAAVPAVAVQEM
jgi:hypothetical protein